MIEETNARMTDAAGLAMDAILAWQRADGSELRRIREKVSGQSKGAFEQECCELIDAVAERMCVALDYSVVAPGAAAVWMQLLAHAAGRKTVAITRTEPVVLGRRASRRNGRFVQ